MKILAIDAATEACSAALLTDGALREQHEVIGRGHADRLLPMADALLREAGLTVGDLDGIAFGRGPGSFTGLRVAAGVAQGLAAGAGKPILPVSNLAAVAAAAGRITRADRVLACMDARMGEVFWAAFENSRDLPRAVGEERLTAPDAVTLPDECAWHGAGHGFSAHPGIAARFGTRLAGVDATILPHASDIARIAAADLAAGRGRQAADGLPVYLRNEVVHRR